MFRFAWSQALFLIAALSLVALSTGGDAGASPTLQDGAWSAVYSTALQNDGGTCQGGIFGPDSALTDGGMKWNCVADGSPSGTNGTFNAQLVGSVLSGTIAFTGPLPFTSTFSGTLSPDGAMGTGSFISPGWEYGAWCLNGIDDDTDPDHPDDPDGAVNDGCPTMGSAETAGDCANNTDDDGDTRINDGCPKVASLNQQGTYVTGLQVVTPASPPAQTVYAPDAGPGGASLTFAGTSTGGNTQILASPTSEGDLPGQFSLVGDYYRVITNNTTTPPGPYIFCAGYIETTPGFVDGTAEESLRIMHLDDANGWQLEPSFYGVPGSSIVTNTVCASVTHLSEFALVFLNTSVGGLVSITSDSSQSGDSLVLWAGAAGAALIALAATGWAARRRRGV